MDIFKWNTKKNETLARERDYFQRDSPGNILEGKMTKKQKKIVLDEYENEILEAYESGKLKPSKSQTNYQTIAQNTMKKIRKINIRISDNDLSAIQRKAAKEGILIKH